MSPNSFFGLAVRAKTLDARKAVKITQRAASMRHASICQMLDLPSNKVLARIYPPHLRPSSFFRFCRQVVQHKEMLRVTSHLRLIPAQTITIITAGMPAFAQVHNRVFAQLADLFEDYPEAAQDVLALRHLVKQLGPPFKLPEVQSVEHLQGIKDQFRIETYPRGLRRLAEFLSLRFPDPPFESSELRHVPGVVESRRVGLLLGNCLAEGAFESDCLAGECALFWRPATLFEPYPVVVQIARDPSARDEWHFVTAEAPRHQILPGEHIEWLKTEVQRLQGSISPICSRLEDSKT